MRIELDGRLDSMAARDYHQEVELKIEGFSITRYPWVAEIEYMGAEREDMARLGNAVGKAAKIIIEIADE